MIRKTWIQMGMPVTVCICDDGAVEADVLAVEAMLEEVNQRYSTYLETSEVSRLNAGEISEEEVSAEFAQVLHLCEATRQVTDGFFDIRRGDQIDPSGLVKGWAIQRASNLLTERGFRNHFVDAGGDAQTCGLNPAGDPWRVGIRNPFKREEHVKILALSGQGVATSGTAIRGEHIYNPYDDAAPVSEIVSLTVVADSIYDADRFATAAFAMGSAGLAFIAEYPGLEGYAVTRDGRANYTIGFGHYVS